MANEKVFGSDITRTHNELKNNLYELLKVTPVTPLSINGTEYMSCDFVPKTEKYFIPKKNPRPKVKTVRDIRNIYEKDVSSDLSLDIEKQRNLLLRKIRGGSSKDEETRLLARNMLKTEKPISRTTWQMVININPDNCAHPLQYVLWNGKCIRLNGSRGGKHKFIYKYDLSERRSSLLHRYKFKKSSLILKKDLLKNSLNVKFKPGPLSRKTHLDDSHQKFNIGNSDLIHLPKPGLDILTEYGKPLDAVVANILHNSRDENGVISDKWAEFALSALGTNDDGRVVQLNEKKYVTFDLGYKYNQRRLLMRCDNDKIINEQQGNQIFQNTFTESEDVSKQEIQKMLDEITVSVEIKLMENNMYTGEDPPREVDIGDTNYCYDNQTKDKVKRKGQSELNRLDVTVIRLCDNQDKNEIVACRKSFCTLGCICDSLISYRLKSHCGHIECMFECRCDFNVYNLNSSFEDNIIPGLISLDREKNSKLAKEEQKFHQTVILSGEKSILLKSQRRNWRAPERYADFYSNKCLKAKKDIKQVLSVLEIKLNCENIEPWCMVHNLYKCFCKGKFIEKLPNEEAKLIDSEQSDTHLHPIENIEAGVNCKNNEAATTKTILRHRISCDSKNIIIERTKSLSDDTEVSYCNRYRCARIKPYRKRKYSDIFYSNTNKKIMELEENDHGLHKRLLEILKIDESDIKEPRNGSTVSTIESLSPITVGQNSPTNNALNKTIDEPKNNLPIHSDGQKLCEDVITTQFTSPAERHLNNKLKAWLEPSLKMYRQRFGKGFFKTSLEPPKAGKITLYPWDFILSRYHEKKNLFLVTNQKPFRIFMAVDHRNTLFNNCININTIEDLENYPISVKNIISQEVDRLKDQLCILRGLSFCWELVGSVKKVGDHKNSNTENDANELPVKDLDVGSPQKLPCTNVPASPVNDMPLLIPSEINTEQSKWFVMTVENDFSEIQFYERGFFVKYDSIIKAINVARVSNKTVRLSSQRCGESSTDPQFGIYAVPIVNEYCVFIGPYEKNQPLGIETVKASITNQKSKTRGVWITTNKVDNLQVIDNPLSFMAQVNLDHGQILDDSLQDEAVLDSACSTNGKGVVKEKENSKVVKLVKPIKITRTNNFYHLTPSGILKPIPVSSKQKKYRPPILIKKRTQEVEHLDLETSTANSSLLRKLITPQSSENNEYSSIEEKLKTTAQRPIAEIAPQIKILEKCRDSINTKQKPRSKFECGMFILKPEEINSRSLVNKICITSRSLESPISAGREINMDIENFLANSVECTAPMSDVYVISDDEDYCNTEPSKKGLWKEVYITCSSVKQIGWIPGRQDEKGHLSFEFPGFKYTEFYPEHEAYDKINQVLARKVYIPDHVNLRWSIEQSKSELSYCKQLKQEDLKPNCVLTKRGLIHKSEVAEHVNKKIKTYSKKVYKKKSSPNTSNAKEQVSIELDTDTSLDDMDVKSEALLERGEQLLNATMEKKGELSNTLSNMTNDTRQKISDRLRSIIANYS